MPQQNELLQKLTNNTLCLISQANNQDWLLLHMAAILKYLYFYRLSLDDTAIVEEVFQLLEALQAYICPADTAIVGCQIEIFSKIQHFYEKALAIAEELQLQTELRNLDLLYAKFLQIPKIQPQVTCTPLVPPDYPAFVKSLNTYCGYLLEAHRAQDQTRTTTLTREIDILETRFLLKMLEPNTQAPIPLIKNLAVKLYQNQTGNPDFSKGLLQIFTTILERATTPQNLELLAFLSNLAFPEVAIDTQYLPDWQRYRTILQAHRAELAKDISPTNTLVAQHNFSRNLQNLTKLMLQECFDLLGAPTPPHRLCFLMLGSMSRMDMQPYSDFEYALLEDGIKLDDDTNQKYTEKLLKLFEFKIHSLGEQSLSGPGEPPSSGFHLDAEGHPGNTSPFMERFRGTPQELIERCLHYWEQPCIDPDNFCHLQISYSLLQADYLWGACDLWQEYQHQLTSFLTPERRKPLAEKYLQFHSAEFMAGNDATTGIKIKDLVIAPLLYLLQDIYLHKTITSTCNHSIVNILENLVTQKIISPDFAADCSRILKLTQFLRYQEQSNVQRQVKPELVANTEELEGALSLIRATHEVTYILSLTGVTTTETPSITALNIASLPFDPLLLKLHAFEQSQLSNKPDQAIEICTIYEPAIPIELTLLIKNRIWTLTLHQASILKYKEYYVQLPTKMLREIMLGFIENYESQPRRQIIWETLARYPNCDGTRPFVDREEEQWLKVLAHLFATNDQDASSAILTIVYMDKRKVGRLHNKIFACLVDSTQKKLKTQSCGGTHLVLPVQIGDDKFHFKFYPENPGYEIAAARLHKLVIGHGASQSVLARLELLGNIYPVLISKTVAGQDLSLVLHKNPDTSITLDPKLYSQLFLISLLLQPEDGKPDNYVLQEITIDGKKYYTLVCIDNDHVFAKPVEETSSHKLKQIFTKTIIYCLEQFRKQPLNQEAIAEFLLLKPIYLLGSWLKELRKYAHCWDSLFSQPESEKYAKMPELTQQSLLRLKLPFGLMGLLYQQFCTMQEILKSCIEQQTTITPYELLKRKNRKLAKFYKQLFENFKTPKQRFAEIARLYYNSRTTQKGPQEIVRYQSRIDSQQMLTLSFGIRTNLLELIRQGGYTITLSQQELEIIAHRYKTRKETIAHLESGNEKLIKKELNILQKMPKTEVGAFLSRIVNQLDFAKVLPKFHITILNLFANISIDKLLLRNCHTLTYSLLLTILTKQPNLRMLQLEGCSDLSIIKLPFLPNLMSIRIKGCANLQSIEMLEKASREPNSTRTLARLTVLEIIDCPKMDMLQIPVPTWQLKQQLCFKDHRYYINKYRIMIKKLFVHYSKMYIDAMLLNLYREISTSKAIINYELHKKLEQVIKKYLLVLENNRVIPALTLALQDNDENVRRYVAYALGQLGNTDRCIISTFITALRDKNEYVRSNAAEALELDKADEHLISRLIIPLHDKDWLTRSNATETLGLGNAVERFISPLIMMALQDKDIDVRSYATLTLSKLGNTDERVISPFIMALQDADQFVRSNAILALVKLGNTDQRVISPLIIALRDKDKYVRRNAILALVKLGNTDQRVISPFIMALQDADQFVRSNAILALVKLGNTDQRVISPLIIALHDEYCLVRKNAAAALGIMGNANQRVISPLVSALQDTHWFVRSKAAKALGKLGNADERVISSLITALQDYYAAIRSKAAKALGKLGNADERVISSLITALQDIDEAVRSKAAEALGNLGNADQRIISSLVSALQDKDKEVRSKAAIALYKLGNVDQRIIYSLVSALQDKNWPVRSYAIKALAKLGNADERVISSLITALQDIDVDVRSNASEALVIMGNADQRIISSLVSALQDKDKYVRIKAAETLAKLGNADQRVISSLVSALQDKDKEVRSKTAEALGKLGNADERVISALITALQDIDVDVRSNASEALVIMGNADQRIISSLVSALQDKDKYVRIKAAETLAKLGNADQRVISALITALQDKDKEVRWKAAKALGKLGNADQRVISSLISALQDTDEAVRSKTAKALGNLRNADKRVISALITALQDKHEHVRSKTAEALGNLRNADERVISALITALQDTHWFVRSNAAVALYKLGNAGERLISRLIIALQDENKDVRSKAATILGKLGNADERVISSLIIRALQDTVEAVRSNATEALGNLRNADQRVISRLIIALHDEYWLFRNNAAIALGNLGNPEERVISSLVSALQDKYKEVRSKAAEALGNLGNPEERVIAPLVTALQNKHWLVRSKAAEALGKLGNADERVISRLIIALQDENKDVRSNATEALGKLGNADKRVISPLITALHDKDWGVRRSAAEALGKLDNNEERVISSLVSALQDENRLVRSNAAIALGKILSLQNSFATQIRQTITPYIAPEHRPIRFFGNTSKIPAITSCIMHNVFIQLNISTLPLKQQRQFFALSRVSKSWYSLFQHPTLTAQREATKKLLETQDHVAAIPSVNPIKGKSLPSNPTTVMPTTTQCHIHPGLEHQKIVGDGNCLYRAVTLYLNNGEDIAFLRNMVAANLKHNAEDYREFIPLAEGQSLQDYIVKLRDSHEWAGNVEINILMRLLNRPIVIIGPEGTLRNLDDISRYQEHEPIFVYYNGEDHYDALILAAGCDGKVILAELLNSAPMVSQSSETPMPTTPSL